MEHDDHLCSVHRRRRPYISRASIPLENAEVCSSLNGGEVPRPLPVIGEYRGKSSVLEIKCPIEENRHFRTIDGFGWPGRTWARDCIAIIVPTNPSRSRSGLHIRVVPRPWRDIDEALRFWRDEIFPVYLHEHF